MQDDASVAVEGQACVGRAASKPFGKGLSKNMSGQNLVVLRTSTECMSGPHPQDETSSPYSMLPWTVSSSDMRTSPAIMQKTGPLTESVRDRLSLFQVETSQPAQ